MEQTEVKVIRLPVSIKIEDAAKGEQRVTVTIDGEDWEDTKERVVACYRAVKVELGG